MLTKIKQNWIFIVLAIIIALIVFWADEYNPALASINWNVGGYASSSLANITTGNKTVMYWSYATSTTGNVNIWQSNGAGPAFAMQHRGVSPFNMFCYLGGTVSDTGLPEPTSTWSFHACSGNPNTGGVHYLVLNLDGSTYVDSSATVTSSTGAYTNFVIGANGTGAGTFNGSMRSVIVVDAILTSAQMRCYAFAKDPFRCGGGVIELVCPLVNIGDSRCYKPQQSIRLNFFGTSIYGKEPPINIKTF